MSTPRVSVIVPVYNCERFVREALDSVLAQGVPDLEIVVVDDGSTDATLQVVEQFGSVVRVLRQRNLGPAAARNRAVRASRGRYLAFLDGDDVWLPGKLQAQLDYLESDDAFAIVFTRFTYWRPDAAGGYPPAAQVAREGHGARPEQPWSGWLYPQILLRTPIHIITTLIRREVYDAVGGFDESLRGGSDYDFWLKATRRYQAFCIPSCGALYRLHGAGVTSVPKPVNYGYLILTRALADLGRCGPDGRCVDEPALQARLAELCFRFGRLHYLKGDARLARSAFLRAFRHDSRQIRALAYAGLASVRSALGGRVSDALYRSAKALSSRRQTNA
jgi:glycosyltransferase involved in cell wall biosynthesis